LPKKGDRQNLMFSATFSTDVRAIAGEFMNEYYFISATKGDLQANDNIEQNLIQVKDENDKVFKLHEILQKIRGSVISKQNLTISFP
jgi:superfamily II DNA/RNA helicase